jgi:hypothetical protein
MSANNPIMNERVRFTLNHSELGTVIIDEPIGWDSTDEKEYARNEDYHGIFAKFSNSLKFVGSGYDFLFNVKEIFGIQTKVRLSKEEKHPKTDEWTKMYDGYLDMSTYENDEDVNEISVKFNSGGLEEMLKARDSEEIELSRSTAMDGLSLENLENITKVVNLNGRKIFLKSKWDVRDTNTEEMDLSVFSDAGNTRSFAEGYPFEKLLYQSHEEAQSVFWNSEKNEEQGSTGMMFIANVDRERTFRIRGENISFKTLVTRFDYQWAFFKVSLVTYKDGSDYNTKTRNTLIHFGENSTTNPNLLSLQNRLHILNFDETVTVFEGESLALEVLIKADLQGGGGARFTVKLSERTGSLYVDEDSQFGESKAKFILAHEYLDRIFSIISNRKDSFRSKFFGRTDIGYSSNGPGALTGLTHGFWVRGFDALPDSTEDNPNLFKPITTSFKDAMTSFNAIWNVGLGIERIGYKEKIVIEDLRYFYSRNVTIKLPNQVNKIKRTVATKYVYSGIEIGCEKGGDYSEAMGLDEYNGISKFNTMITVIKNAFVKISKYRTDSYGKEFARRKQFSNDPTLDTSYDSDIFAMDLKKSIGTTYDERVWQDDFEVMPNGTYSPETATNLRFSPVNMLLRHGWEVAASLTKYPTDFLRYGSSTANSNLKTKLIGKDEFSENGNIQNSELEKARYTADYVEFEHELNFELLQQIEGFTIVDGERIYNIYGLIEFKTNKGTERGWLINLKPGGTGKWKLLQFNI